MLWMCATLVTKFIVNTCQKNKGGAVLAVHFIGGTVYKEDVVKHSSVTNVKRCTYSEKFKRKLGSDLTEQICLAYYNC